MYFHKEVLLARKAANRLYRQYIEKPGKSLRVGFVGCGHHSNANLYPSLRHASLDLVAVCSRHLENSARVGKKFGATRFFDDYERMFKEVELDAVLVCISPEIHGRVVLSALNNNLPVFVEKPPAESSTEAEAIHEIATSKNLNVMVGFMKRHSPAVAKAKEITQSSEFGKVNLIQGKFVVGSMGSEVELLKHVAIHHIDLARHLVGEIDNIYLNRYRQNGEVSMSVNFSFNTGAVGSFVFSSIQSWVNENERIEIFGEESAITIYNNTELEYHRPNISIPGELPSTSDMNFFWKPNFSVPAENNQTIFLNGYVYELRHFAHAIANKTPVSPNMRDGYLALKVVEDILAREP